MDKDEMKLLFELLCNISKSYNENITGTTYVTIHECKYIPK